MCPEFCGDVGSETALVALVREDPRFHPSRELDEIIHVPACPPTSGHVAAEAPSQAMLCRPYVCVPTRHKTILPELTHRDSMFGGEKQQQRIETRARVRRAR